MTFLTVKVLASLWFSTVEMWASLCGLNRIVSFLLLFQHKWELPCTFSTHPWASFYVFNRNVSFTLRFERYKHEHSFLFSAVDTWASLFVFNSRNVNFLHVFKWECKLPLTFSAVEMWAYVFNSRYKSFPLSFQQ